MDEFHISFSPSRSLSLSPHLHRTQVCFSQAERKSKSMDVSIAMLDCPRVDLTPLFEFPLISSAPQGPCLSVYHCMPLLGIEKTQTSPCCAMAATRIAPKTAHDSVARRLRAVRLELPRGQCFSPGQLLV